MVKRNSSFLSMLFKLTIGGGVAFWATTFVTSLLPLAAEYRATFSNWNIKTVWIASLFMGMIIGCFVSYFLLRFMDKNPVKNPISNSVKLSAITLLIAITLVDVPQIFHGQGDILYYFLIGVMFNVVRFLLLGLTIGYLYKKLY